MAIRHGSWTNWEDPEKRKLKERKNFHPASRTKPLKRNNPTNYGQ